MGKEFDSVQGISYTEVADYLKELKEKDPGGLGDKLRPMDMMYGELSWQYSMIPISVDFIRQTPGMSCVLLIPSTPDLKHKKKKQADAKGVCSIVFSKGAEIEKRKMEL